MLTPAIDAVDEVVPALKEIENLISVPEAERVKALDLGKAEHLAALEEEQYRD